uniref:Uncharacterized protein n=1 Tax=Syphacia muris TaxID=451379 RepID=A0A0N5AE92_9BILA
MNMKRLKAVNVMMMMMVRERMLNRMNERGKEGRPIRWEEEEEGEEEKEICLQMAFPLTVIPNYLFINDATYCNICIALVAQIAADSQVP